MKKPLYQVLQNVLFTAVGFFTFVLLLYLCVTPNIKTTRSRELSGYTTVENVSYSERTDDEGLVRQFRFRLEENIEYDTTLIFRFHHANVDVYLEGENIYSMHKAEEMHIVCTPGGHWVMIPLYREDVGKEVTVELRPVYSNYQKQSIPFYIGSKLALYTEQLKIALPEMILCLADVFAGLMLFGVAVYFAIHKHNSGRLCALGTLAIAMGLWNFTQTNFVCFIFPEKTALIYTISVVMLTISVIALIKSVRKPKDVRPKHRIPLLEWWSVCYAAFVLVQLILQLLGVWDLRKTLTVVHIGLVVTAVIMINRSIADWRNARKVTGAKTNGDYLWMLGVGVLLDMVNYYSQESTRLVFVLAALFLYVLIEGIQLFTSYVKQQQLLEEKETQLTMSRITTMMSQIRSHFVFNVLNAISGMCKYDPEKADETVVRFSRYLRNNIDIMEDDKNIPFLQEMERLEDYVVLEQIRFGDRIEFTTDIEADQFSIPPLILQPIVENAIKHGISKRKEGGRINLSTKDTGESIQIIVTDNGVGFSMDALHKDTSVGLRNIRFRLYHLVGGTMDIKSTPGVGTTVTLTIPKEDENAPDICR